MGEFRRFLPKKSTASSRHRMDARASTLHNKTSKGQHGPPWSGKRYCIDMMISVQENPTLAIMLGPMAKSRLYNIAHPAIFRDPSFACLIHMNRTLQRKSSDDCFRREQFCSDVAPSAQLVCSTIAVSSRPVWRSTASGCGGHAAMAMEVSDDSILPSRLIQSD
jgi:hypothetical protein